MPTVDQLYEMFMDEGEYKGTDKSFSEDVFNFLNEEDLLTDIDWSKKDWRREFGIYLPKFDPTGTRLAAREKDLSFQRSMDTLDLTQKATDRVYNTELEALSTELGREMEKGRSVAGGLGVRSGGLETAIGETVELAGGKAEDLGDRLMISEKEAKNTHNVAMIKAALDYEKTERQEKEDFYDRTMESIMTLGEQGAFEQWLCPEGTALAGEEPITCPEDSGFPGERKCGLDECNLYTGLTGVGTELIIAEAITTCIESGNYSREVCEEYSGDMTEIALKFGQGDLGTDVLPYLDTLGETLEDDWDRFKCLSEWTTRCNIYCIGTGKWGIGISASCVNRCKNKHC